MDHNRIVTVTVQDPDLEQVPGDGGPDHHDEVIVINCRALHLITDCVEDVFVGNPVLPSDIRDPH